MMNAIRKTNEKMMSNIPPALKFRFIKITPQIDNKPKIESNQTSRFL